jgi:hypothetical protein
MRYFYEKLSEHLKGLNPPMTFNQLHFKAGIPSGHFSLWKKPKNEKGSRLPTDPELERIADVPELGLTLETLRGWRALDEYSKEEIFAALDSLPEEELEIAFQQRFGNVRLKRN